MSDPHPDSAVTRDLILGGRVVLNQPKKGYRAGVDPVFLAAAVPARPGQSALDWAVASARRRCVWARGCLAFGWPDWSSVRADHAAREAAMGEETPLAAWVAAAARRCKPRGTVTFVHRTERLPDLLSAFQACLGSLVVKPLIPRQGRESQLCLVQGRKEGRAAFRLAHGLVVHDGLRHERDGTDYTTDAANILGAAAALEM
eukprot:g15463.t1